MTVDEIRALAQLMREYGLTSLDCSDKDGRVRLERGPRPPRGFCPPAPPERRAEAVPLTAEEPAEEPAAPEPVHEPAEAVRRAAAALGSGLHTGVRLGKAGLTQGCESARVWLRQVSQSAAKPAAPEEPKPEAQPEQEASDESGRA